MRKILFSPDLRRPLAAGASYALALIVLVAFGASSWLGLWNSWTALSEATELRDQLNARTRPGGLEFSASPPAGAAFLEAQTLTVAGAALQQRVGAIIAESGGSVLSSQVDVQGPQAASGRVGLVVSCDLDQTGLQKALYTIESGMPVLFVEQLFVQAGQAGEPGKGGRMRVQIGVAAQWREVP